MVKAILEGRKTQSRRLRGLELINRRPDIWIFGYLYHGIVLFDIKGELDRAIDPTLPIRNIQKIKCAYGQVGDRLWVRETFAPNQLANGKTEILYRADGKLTSPYAYTMADGREILTYWKPPIFMPRGASRITLEITEIRVERLQEITIADIEAEGHQPFKYPDGTKELSSAEAYTWYRALWNSLNAKRGYGWETNPWVWVISFATGVRLK